MASLDPSIYGQLQPNLAMGMGDVVNRYVNQTQADEERKNKLAMLAQQGQMQDIQLQQARNELAMQPQRMEEERRAKEAKYMQGVAREIAASPEQKDMILNRHAELAPQFGIDPNHITWLASDLANSQNVQDRALYHADPQEYMKRQLEAKFRKPAAPSPVGTLMQERDELPQNDPRRAIYDAAIKKATEKQDNTLVAVVGPDGVTPVLVPRSQAAGQAPFQKPGTKNQPLTKQQIDQSSLTAQQALNQLQKLYEHPGRQAGTGASSFLSVIPATEAKGFSSELKTFQSKAFLDAVQAMKGLGALTEAEGARLVSSIGALDPSMKESDFEDNLRQVAQDMYNMAKAKGLNVKMPKFAINENEQQVEQITSHPADIQAILNKHR